MDALIGSGRSYPLDRRGFLADPGAWDLDFCAAMAPRLGLSERLTLLQLKVVLFVRRRYVQRGAIARVHETCRGCGLTLAGLRRLFPCGYQRGVCRLAGIPFRVIDRCHNALTYETVARPSPVDHGLSSPGLPRASGEADD
jgi:tRNA 2-thiouridine synthesizing protein E